MNRLEKLVYDHILFQNKVEWETFPIAFQDANKWIVYHGYQAEKIDYRIYLNDVLTYLQMMYGYTIKYECDVCKENKCFITDKWER